MKKHNRILTTLFCLTALLLFAPLMQQNLELFRFKHLVGYKKPAPKPVLTFKTYANSTFQQQEEQYLKEHFGFREPLIRMYNQCTYDLFKTTSNKEISIGTDGWLYHAESALQYYGNMESWFDLSNSQVRDNLIKQARSLAKVNAILKEHDVHLLTFTLPTKSFIYPEHLRKQPVGDTTFNATPFFAHLLDSLEVPHINMTSWFQQLQDTTPFDLFYSKGSHWAAGTPLAVDTMLRYMEQTSGQSLTRIQLGTPYALEDIPFNDKDLELLLNLARPLKHEPIHEYPISLLTDDSTTFPTVWFVGTSFYWYMTRRINFDVLFRDRDLLFYDAVFHTDREQTQLPAENLDYLHELLLHDYVVFFRDGPQLYTKALVFPGKSLISLCINEERLKEKTDMLADSIMRAWWPMTHYDTMLCYSRASFMLQQNPEIFEELRGDDIPTCRNPRIAQVLSEKRIRADRNWSFLLSAKAKNDSLNLRNLFRIEAFNALENKPLLCKQVYFSTYDYFDFLVEEAIINLKRRCTDSMPNVEAYNKAKDEIEARIRQHAFDDDTLMMLACEMDAIVRQLESEKALSSIREKAMNRNVSIDKAFKDDVLWCLRNNDNAKTRHQNEDILAKAFDAYQIERRIRKNEEAMANIMKKHSELNLPLRIVINRDIEWTRKNRLKQ